MVESQEQQPFETTKSASACQVAVMDVQVESDQSFASASAHQPDHGSCFIHKQQEVLEDEGNVDSMLPFSSGNLSPRGELAVVLPSIREAGQCVQDDSFQDGKKHKGFRTITPSDRQLRSSLKNSQISFQLPSND